MVKLDWKPILMIPGPSEVAPEVLAALSRPILPHYGREWGKIYEETVDLAAKVFDTRGEVILFPAPGSAALEMGIANLVGPDEKVIVIVNGFFGERAAEIARHLGCRVVELQADYGDYVKPQALEEALQVHKDARAVVVVHNESSTGMRNPVKTYGRIVEGSNALFIVEAISSYGGVEIHVDEWAIDFCVGYSGKALSAAPGVAPIAVSHEALSVIESRRWEPRSWFLNLKVWKTYIDKWSSIGHPYPTTVPTHSILGLREALRMAINEGLDERYERHEKMAAAFREAARAMGLETVAPEEYASPTVTAIRVPEGLCGKLLKEMLERFNIMISGGLGRLEGKAARVGHMGITATTHYLVYTITALAYTLRKLGFETDEGVALEAFYSSLGIR